MKIYISADIEGVAGITVPEEANPDLTDIDYFRRQMTEEVVAACEGAVRAGADEILVKDAHADGRNIDARRLPRCAKLLRGWTGHPFGMMAEIDPTHTAALMVGYHARAGSGGNPLAHTMSGRHVAELRINDRAASEFYLNTLTATMLDVPVLFVSGDEDLCQEVRSYNEAIHTYATFVGIGTGTLSLQPELVVDGIREGVFKALRDRDQHHVRPLPETFTVEIDYKAPRFAYGFSFFPGAELLDDRTVRFSSDDYFEVLRMLKFALS